MGQITGWFDGLTPWVRLHVGGFAVDCIVDSGFDGDLVLPRRIVDPLGLPVISNVTSVLADGSVHVSQEHAGQVDWMGAETPVGVLVAAGEVALLGIHLLRDCRVMLSAREGVVRIERH